MQHQKTMKNLTRALMSVGAISQATSMVCGGAIRATGSHKAYAQPAMVVALDIPAMSSDA